jgi:adenylate cyclase
LGHAHVRETQSFQEVEDVLRTLIEAFRSQAWDAADEAIARGRNLKGVPVEILDTYAERVHHFRLEPPPPDWDGSWSARDK